MTYQCNDCSFTRNGVFPGGKCPACSSFNISGGANQHTDKVTQSKPWRLALLAVLWAYLFFMLYRKLFISY